MSKMRPAGYIKTMDPMCQGFSKFSVFFASLCIGQISHQQHKSLRDTMLDMKGSGRIELFFI